MNQEIQYFILLTTLLLLPKILLRFRIPSGLTAMALGVATTLGLGWFTQSQLLATLSTLGITSLFLFAGLEVDIEELKKNWKILIEHIVQSVFIIFISSYFLGWAFNLNFRPALILSLGLTTPSTGFILNSLNSFDFTAQQRYWIRSKAITKEVLALIILFFVLQSESLLSLSGSLLAIVTLTASLPFLFRFFLKIVAPYAPDSEVSFLILLAFLAGVITYELGTYYLIGAFIVGIVAAQFRHFIKTENAEKMFYSVAFFSSLFVPFYFFKVGINLGDSQLTWWGLIYGLIFLTVFIPLRYFSVILSIKFFLKGCWSSRQNIALPLMPTLIFSLVISQILRSRFDVSVDIVNGLVIYTILSSIIPSLFLEKAPPEEYDTAFVQN